jgi:hypothetical protein
MSEGGGPPSRREELLRLLAADGPTYVDLGDGLARLEVWSRSRWDALDRAERPGHAEYFEGLGWVVAIPVRDLN